MKKHFQSFLLHVLVVASLPALQGYRRTLQAITPGPAPSPGTAPGSSAAPAPTPSPGTAPGSSAAPAPTPSSGTAPGSSAAPAPTLVPVPSPPQLPPPSGGGGGGGGSVVPKDRGGRSSGLSGGQKAGIVMGVLAGVGLIGFATMMYMKRRSNIQRARFGVLASRRSHL